MRFLDVQPKTGIDVELGTLLSALDDSTLEWRENLGIPPIESIGWQMYPNAPSIGALLLHMIDTEAYWFETFAAKKARPRGESKMLLSKETKVLSGTWPTPPHEPIEWYFNLHDQIRNRAVQAIFGLNEPGKTYSGKSWSVTLRWIVAHVLEHDSYHGGQAVMLHEMWKKIGRASGRSD